MLSETGKPAEALAACEHARTIFDRLAREIPSVTKFQRGLAVSHQHIGNLLRLSGKPSGALGAFEQARGIGERLPARGILNRRIARPI